MLHSIQPTEKIWLPASSLATEAQLPLNWPIQTKPPLIPSLTRYYYSLGCGEVCERKEKRLLANCICPSLIGFGLQYNE
jgi:hypothetical protein